MFSDQEKFNMMTPQQKFHTLSGDEKQAFYREEPKPRQIENWQRFENEASSEMSCSALSCPVLLCPLQF